MTAEEEEEDLILQRASSTLLQKLLTRFPNLLWKKDGQEANLVHRYARQKDVDDILALIKPFQENPQLLDSHLATFLPSLFTAYLHDIEATPKTPANASFLPLKAAISKVACTFCEVRGYKVVSRLFINEPRLIKTLSERLYYVTCNQADTIWEERYIITLWISHLLLVPFDLAAVADAQGSLSTLSSSPLTVDLPEGLSNVAERLVKVCFQLIRSPAKEREAAALALSRLCLRHDMHKKGLTETIVKDLLKRLKEDSQSNQNIYLNLGILLFLEKLVAAAAYESGDELIQSIYPTLLMEFEEGNLTPLSDSAAAKKLFVKILRNSAVRYLSTPKAVEMNDKITIIEQMIDYLFLALKDRDSSVRFAAGKALGILVKYFEPSLSKEIIDSILLPFCMEQPGSLEAEYYNALSPLESHGLTLTLSLMLFQQSIPSAQIGKVVDCLHNALNFHQLSPAGVSVGSNVRDAACFGLWSLSRRYSSKQWDLPNVISKSEITGQFTSVSTIQNVALDLLSTACLDPAGNIRRGASAALQELIGRNPGTVEKGISLIQVADYQAVGLRKRAVCKVAVQAADIHERYWEGILNSLLGWKGLRSVDAPSRVVAATAIGRMCKSKPLRLVLQIIDHLFHDLFSCAGKETERIHGVTMAILSIMIHRLYETKSEDFTLHSDKLRNGYIEDVAGFHDLILRIRPQIYSALKIQKSTGPSFGIQGIAICSLLRCMAELEIQILANRPIFLMKSLIDKSEVLYLLDEYMDCNDKHFLTALADLCRVLFLAFSSEELEVFAQQCLNVLREGAYKVGKKASGRLIALGNMLPDSRLTPNVQMAISDELHVRCTKAYSIPNRLIALRSIRQAFKRFSACSTFDPIKSKLAAILLRGLNDYTIDERGDIGSLVRREALLALQEAQRNTAVSDSIILNEDLEAAVLRLAAEKMDKIRTEAAVCLAQSGKISLSQHALPSRKDNHDALIGEIKALDIYAASSQVYFAEILSLLSSGLTPVRKRALIEGFCSSAGAGSEFLVHSSRFALVSALQNLPLDDSECRYSVRNFADDLLYVLSENFEIDRVVIPLLEVIIFLLDTDMLTRLQKSNYKWKTLFYYVQKSHYKSSNVAKLMTAVQVYRGLTDISSIRSEVIKKLTSMLIHPFPKVRTSVAECLLQVTNNEELKRHDWTAPLDQLRHVALQKG